MSRPLRLAFPAALYHVTSRGNAGKAILQLQEKNKVMQNKRPDTTGVCTGSADF